MELLPRTGAEGVWLTTTSVVAVTLHVPPNVTVSVYVPEAPVVADGMVGLGNADPKPNGPAQLNVTPVVLSVDVSITVLPEQTGLLLPAVGTAGVESTTAYSVAMPDWHTPSVAITE